MLSVDRERKKDGRRLDMFYVIICAIQCNSLVTSFPSHQVFIFTHTHSVHFSAFSLHNPPCVTSHQHTPRHGYNAVAVKRGSVAPAGIYCAQIGTRSRQNRPKRWEKVKYCGPVHTLRFLPDHGGDVCKVWLRSVQKCGFV